MSLTAADHSSPDTLSNIDLLGHHNKLGGAKPRRQEERAMTRA